MPSPPQHLKAILFDLDGTCVNSDHLHFSTYRDTLLDLAPTFNNGLPITRHFYDTHMSGLQNPALVAALLPALPAPARAAIWRAKEARYEALLARGLPPIPGLPALLARAKAARLPTYIVTNAPRPSCHATMVAIGIAPHFGPRVVVADECHAPKPHPAPYLRALALAGLPPEHALAFEDSPSGTASATAAGLFTIGLRSTQSDQALRAAGAAFTVEDYRDPVLHNILARWLQ